MRLEFIPLDKLSVSKSNMRWSRKAPDVSDILPTVRAKGVLTPVIVRPNCAPDCFEIVAGSRRFHAASIVAEEHRAAGQEVEPMPCAILDDGDDATAIEASMIENFARLDPDEVTRWETFTRLIKEGRTPDDIAATFGLPDLAVKRILALGNLLPRIRALYAHDQIDVVTIRHLTLATKRQQQDWLKLADDSTARAPTGQQLKAWLMGGQAIAAKMALFDVDASGLTVIADLFGEDRYFADASLFWAAQDAAIEARRAAYLEQGWRDVTILPATDYFHSWEFEKTAKRKGGRVYIDVRPNGEVTFHEGYLSRKDAARAARGDTIDVVEKPKRPELTAAMSTYVDLHRHAAVRTTLTDHPGVALRLMLAHAIIGSPLWSVRREPQSARDDGTCESIESSLAEARFDERRRAVLALLGMSPERPTVTGGNADDEGLARLFLRLLDLPDPAILDVVVVVMGETLCSGSAAVEAIGVTLGVNMADYWQADAAFFDLVRDKEVLGAMVADVAGDAVAAANTKEKGSTLKRIINDHLDGIEGRTKVEHWVPRWMTFPPSAYTERGGVGSVRANAVLDAARSEKDDVAQPELADDAGDDDRESAELSNDTRDGDRQVAEPENDQSQALAA